MHLLYWLECDFGSFKRNLSWNSLTNETFARKYNVYFNITIEPTIFSVEVGEQLRWHYKIETFHLFPVCTRVSTRHTLQCIVPQLFFFSALVLAILKEFFFKFSTSSIFFPLFIRKNVKRSKRSKWCVLSGTWCSSFAIESNSLNLQSCLCTKEKINTMKKWDLWNSNWTEFNRVHCTLEKEYKMFFHSYYSLDLMLLVFSPTKLKVQTTLLSFAGKLLSFLAIQLSGNVVSGMKIKDKNSKHKTYVRPLF